MSSTTDSKQTAQNNLMRECSERGDNILSALSKNYLRQAKISIQGLPLSGQETVLKSSPGEHLAPREIPPWINSTHPCHQSPAGLHEGNQVPCSPTSSRRDTELAVGESEKSLKDCVLCNIPQLADFETRSADVTSSYSTRGKTVDESEGLVETEDMGPRNLPLRSILKKERMTPTTMTLDLERVSHDASNQQTIFNEIELVSKSKMADHETDSRRGLIVFIPNSKYRRMSTKHIIQLAAMSGCGFILVALIVAWVFSPTFL